MTAVCETQDMMEPLEEPNGQTPSGYRENGEHLADELRRLDLMLALQLDGRLPQGKADSLQPFQGLVVSEREVRDLLSSETATGSRGAGGADGLAAIGRMDSLIEDRIRLSRENGVFLALPALSRIFGLTEFERMCLVVCLAPELDRKYERVFGYLHDDVTRKSASADLILNLLCGNWEDRLSARTVFEWGAPLRRYRLLHVGSDHSDEEAPLLGRSVRMDDRVAGFLTGSAEIAPELKAMARIVPAGSQIGDARAAEELRPRLWQLVSGHLQTGPGGCLAVHLRGRHGSGRLSLAQGVCEGLGCSLLVADARRMLQHELPFETVSLLLCRETALQGLVLGIEKFDALLGDDPDSRLRLETLMEAVEAFCRVAVLMGSAAWQPIGMLRDTCFVGLDCGRPDIKTRKSVWEKLLTAHPGAVAADQLVELSGKFRFTPGQIRDSIARAEQLARWESPEDPQLTWDHLQEACRSQSNKKLGSLAQVIEPVYGWDDIVLPQDQMRQLRELSDHVRFEQTVMGAWGFAEKLPRGRGLTTLFSGPSGTGKTMAAEVLAKELSLDLYKIDLSGVVNKYIGETEKNLRRIFREAEEGNAILFFDEADALFGKRSEVKDAHDRYANIEIAYLLQQMEEYEGVVILATNLRKNMDDAFVRRMRFIIDFPFPDEGLRERIWRRIFPSPAPLSPDVDHRFLARRLDFAGGNIRNVSVRAAYLAASQGRPIEMEDLILAAKREFKKMGRLYNESKLGSYRKTGVEAFASGDRT